MTTKLDPFTRSYIETMLWESTGGPNGDTPLDRTYGVDDFDPKTLKRIIADCEAFQKECSDWYDDSKSAGHDFWLTRVGAGAGFWDGDYPEPQATLLTNASKRFGHVDVVEGEYDKGPLYLEPSITDARKHARRLEPEAFKPPVVNHATRKTSTALAKKTSTQLDREVDQVVGKRIDRKKLAALMGPWGSDFSYGEGSGAVGAVASYYYSGKKYPDRKWVDRALKAIEADIPKAARGEHGWTKSDANSLRRIAQGLRYYLVHDYNGSAHSTVKRGEELYPTAEARRQVQTIRQRDAFPEILTISMRADGTNYQVKVPDLKSARGYDLVDVLVHHNGARSIKSASRSRITPDRASKIVTRYVEATR
jgi:hypothetical protein